MFIRFCRHRIIEDSRHPRILYSMQQPAVYRAAASVHVQQQATRVATPTASYRCSNSDSELLNRLGSSQQLPDMYDCGPMPHASVRSGALPAKALLLAEQGAQATHSVMPISLDSGAIFAVGCSFRSSCSCFLVPPAAFQYSNPIFDWETSG